MVSTETNGSTDSTPRTVQLIDEDCAFKYPFFLDVDKVTE
jgi:hypothetical protein